MWRVPEGPEGLAAAPVGGGAWPDNEPTCPATRQHTRPHRCEGRRRDRRARAGFEARHRAIPQHARRLRCEGRRRDRRDRRARLRCPWAVAGPGRASSRRAERSSRRGRLAGGPPPTGTPSSLAPRPGPPAPETPVGPQATPPIGRAATHGAARPSKDQPGNARRSSPSGPCARAGASRPGQSGCGPRCAVPRLRCR